MDKHISKKTNAHEIKNFKKGKSAPYSLALQDLAYLHKLLPLFFLPSLSHPHKVTTADQGLLQNVFKLNQVNRNKRQSF